MSFVVAQVSKSFSKSVSLLVTIIIIKCGGRFIGLIQPIPGPTLVRDPEPEPVVSSQPISTRSI